MDNASMTTSTTAKPWSRWFRFKGLLHVTAFSQQRSQRFDSAGPEDVTIQAKSKKTRVVPTPASAGASKLAEVDYPYKEEQIQVVVTPEGSAAVPEEGEGLTCEAQTSLACAAQNSSEQVLDSGGTETESAEEKARVRAFFQEMERNIHRNLQQGLLVADVPDTSNSDPTRTRIDSLDGNASIVNGRARFTLDDTFVDEVVKKNKEPPPMERKYRAVSARNLSQGGESGTMLASLPAQARASALETPNERQQKGRPSLVHSNSTGRLHIDSTLSDPDVTATIDCVCRSILALVEPPPQDDPAPPTPPPARLPQQIFNDDDPNAGNRAPTLIELCKFVKNVYKRGEMHVECLVTAFIYIERLLKSYKGSLHLSPTNWRPIVFSTLILASKVCDDESPVNADWCYVCPSFTVQRINKLELALLTAFKFKPTVAASHYAKYYFHFRSMAARIGLIAGNTVKPLDVVVAKRIARASKVLVNPHNPHKDMHESTNDTHLRRRSTSFDELPGSSSRVCIHNAAALEQVVDMAPTPTGAEESAPFLKHHGPS